MVVVLVMRLTIVGMSRVAAPQAAGAPGEESWRSILFLFLGLLEITVIVRRRRGWSEPFELMVNGLDME